jgi:hypothetical protein
MPLCKPLGAIVGRFHYEYQGEGANVACRVGAVIRGEKEITWNEFLSAATVTTKNSPLWKTNPKQQLGYLQVKKLGTGIRPWRDPRRLFRRRTRSHAGTRHGQTPK